MIGFEGVLPKPMSYQRFKNLVGKTIGGNLQTTDFGKKTVRSVAVVSGGAREQAEEAGRKGIDVYLSGGSPPPIECPGGLPRTVWIPFRGPFETLDSRQTSRASR